MKATIFHEFGDVDVLKYEDVTTPTPKPGNVVVRVLAAGVNRLDHYIREGSVAPDLAFPHTLGMDAVGEVAAVGAGVTEVVEGDRVVPFPGYPANGEESHVHPPSAAASFTLLGLAAPGTYAQYVEVPAPWVMQDESALPAEQIATLPVVLPTAVRAVKHVGEVQAGDKVLVHAAGSGVGSMQVQVAKALGADVAATVRSAAKAEFIEALGADVVINTREDDFLARTRDWTDGRGVDVVLDNIGGPEFQRSVEAVRTQGILVSVGFVAGPEATFNIPDFFFGHKQIRGTLLGAPTDYQWGIEQVRAGHITPTVARTLPLSEAAEAHRLIADNTVAGNLVLLPWAD